MRYFTLLLGVLYVACSGDSSNPTGTNTSKDAAYVESQLDYTWLSAFPANGHRYDSVRVSTDSGLHIVAWGRSRTATDNDTMWVRLRDTVLGWYNFDSTHLDFVGDSMPQFGRPRVVSRTGSSYDETANIGNPGWEGAYDPRFVGGRALLVSMHPVKIKFVAYVNPRIMYWAHGTIIIPN